MGNEFDQFDNSASSVMQGNEFDQFDKHSDNTHLSNQESPYMGAMSGLEGGIIASGNAAADTATFGLNKPLNAAGIAAIDYAKNAVTGAPHENYGDLYDRVMKWQKEQEQTAEQEYPIASNIGTGLGVIGSLGLGLPAKAIGETTTAINAIKSAAKTNAALGGVIGSLNGIGYSQGNAENRAMSGLEGGIIGAGLGAVTPLAIQGIGNIGGKLVSPILSRFTVPHGEQAIEKIAGNITRDNINPADIGTQLGNMGKEAILADVGGKNLQGLGRAIVGMPGKGKEEATNFLNQRQAGQGTRIAESLNSNLGVNTDFYDAEAASQAQQAKAVPLYQQAFKANQNINSPVINRILRTPIGQSSLKKAAEFMQNDMSLMGVPDPELAEQAKLVGTYESGGIAGGLKLRTLDYVKQAMDDQISSLYRNGANKEANSVNSLKNSLLSELDKADQVTTGGKYAQGRSIWAGEARAQEALNMGKSFINDDAVITNRTLNNLPDGEKEMFRIGAAQSVRDKVANTPYGADAGKNIFGDPAELYGSQAKRDRLKALFPDQDSFHVFDNQMKNEARMYATRANITQGSRTAPMAAEMADAGGLDMGHVVEAATGHPIGALLKIGTDKLKSLFNKYQFPEEVRNIISQKMFSNDPIENSKTIEAIQNALKAKSIKMTNRAAFLAGQSGNISGQLNAK